MNATVPAGDPLARRHAGVPAAQDGRVGARGRRRGGAGGGVPARGAAPGRDAGRRLQPGPPPLLRLPRRPRALLPRRHHRPGPRLRLPRREPGPPPDGLRGQCPPGCPGFCDKTGFIQIIMQ